MRLWLSRKGLSVLSLLGLQDSLSDPEDVLDRERCLETLAALRHAKWFQVSMGWLKWGQSPSTVYPRVPLTNSVFPPQGSSQWPAAMCDCHQGFAGAMSLPAPLGGSACLGKASGDRRDH